MLRERGENISSPRTSVAYNGSQRVIGEDTKKGPAFGWTFLLLYRLSFHANRISFPVNFSNLALASSPRLISSKSSPFQPSAAPFGRSMVSPPHCLNRGLNGLRGLHGLPHTSTARAASPRLAATRACPSHPRPAVCVSPVLYPAVGLRGYSPHPTAASSFSPLCPSHTPPPSTVGTGPCACPPRKTSPLGPYAPDLKSPRIAWPRIDSFKVSMRGLVSLRESR